MNSHVVFRITASILLATFFSLASSLCAQSINVTTTGVGIGTLTPASRLDIAGSGGLIVAGGVSLDPSAGFNLGLLQNSGKLLLGWNRTAGGGDIDLIANRGGGSAGGFNFYDYTNSGSLNFIMNLNGNGNVGIGTGNTTAKLTVNRSVGSTIDGELILSAAGQSLRFNSNQSQGAYSGLVQGGDHAIIYSNGTPETGSFTIAQWSNSPRGIRIDANGNVGIGTSSAAYALSVNGQVRSKGFITDTSNWSDYVFTKDYRLPSLAEVEWHIKTEGHLPGIPSEKEAVAHGIDVGDMQVKLLAQVEQLTLHAIEQQKEIDFLKSEIKQTKEAMK